MDNSNPLASAPDWLLGMWPREGEVRQTRNGGAKPSQTPVIPEGERNSTLISLAGTMRRRGMSQSAIESALLAENAERCERPLSDSEVLSIVRSAMSYAPGEPYLNGNDGRKLQQLGHDTPEWEPPDAPETALQPVGERFAPVDLSTQEEPEAMRWVFGNYIPERLPCNLYADGGQGKSTLALALACHIVLGRPFLGLPVMRGPVLILDWELTIEHALRRLYSIARGMGLATPPRDLHYQSLYAPLSHHFGEICEFMGRVKPVLTILDSFGPAAGCDPNDTEAVIEYMGYVRRLPTTPLNIDHQAKPGVTSYSSKRAYGSGYKDYLVRGGMQVEVSASKEGQTSAVLRHTKHNFSAGAEPLAFHILYGPGTIRLERANIMEPDFLGVETLPAAERILRALQTTVVGMTEEDAMFEAGIESTSTFRNNVNKLKKAGKVIAVGETGPNKKQLYRVAETNGRAEA